MASEGIRWKRAGMAEFRARFPDPMTGKTIRRSHTWHGTKRDAPAARANWIAQELAKVTTNPNERTISWLVGKWLDLQESTLSRDTVRTYRGYAKRWIDPTVGQLGIPKLTAGHLRELHAKMAEPHPCWHHDEIKDGCGKCGPCSPSTIHQVHTIIRGSLTYAMEHEWADRNVAAIRTAPKVGPGEVVACTEIELWDLLDEAGERGNNAWTAIALGATLGRRLGQLCMIRHSDIDLDARTVTMRPTRKSPKAKAIPIDDETADVIKTRIEWQQHRWEQVYGLIPPIRPRQRVGMHPKEVIEDPYLLSFFSDGREPDPDSYTGIFTRLRDALGYKHLHFHCLRHYCATTLINAGVPLPVVAERLGHSSPAVTARTYAHVVAGRHDEAAAIAGQSLPLGKRPKPAKLVVA